MDKLHDGAGTHEENHDDSDADAFAVLTLLVIIAAGIVYYIGN